MFLFYLFMCMHSHRIQKVQYWPIECQMPGSQCGLAQLTTLILPNLIQNPCLTLSKTGYCVGVKDIIFLERKLYGWFDWNFDHSVQYFGSIQGYKNLQLLKEGRWGCYQVIDGTGGFHRVFFKYSSNKTHCLSVFVAAVILALGIFGARQSLMYCAEFEWKTMIPYWDASTTALLTHLIRKPHSPIFE